MVEVPTLHQWVEEDEEGEVSFFWMSHYSSDKLLVAIVYLLFLEPV